MAIAKSVVEAHHGKISATSEVQRGKIRLSAKAR